MQKALKHIENHLHKTGQLFTIDQENIQILRDGISNYDNLYKLCQSYQEIFEEIYNNVDIELDDQIKGVKLRNPLPSSNEFINISFTSKIYSTIKELINKLKEDKRNH